MNDGSYRCPSSQQGYSPFSTWTRGLAWAILGYAEQLEFLRSLIDEEIETEIYFHGRRPTSPDLARMWKRLRRQHAVVAKTPEDIRFWMLRAATVTADFYIENSCADGVPMWDTGAPNLHRLGDYVSKCSDPCNQHEPVDSSAAAIVAQGLIRLGNYFTNTGDRKN